MRLSRRTLLLASLAFALASCGGPGGPSAPATPNALSVSPEFVARGETFTVTGTGFGSSGTVTVGGVAADVASWSNTAVVATVPGDTPGGWQDVVVTTVGGSSTVAGPFVGHQYTGDAEGLPDFLAGLEPGEAVMLAAKEYDLTGVGRLTVDNVDLYGRGEATTELTLGASDAVRFCTSPGRTVTVSGLTLRAGEVGYVVHQPAPLAVAGVDGDNHGGPNDSSAAPQEGALVELDLTSPEDLAAALLAPRAVRRAGLVFDGVTMRSYGVGTRIGASNNTAPALDLVLRDVFIDAGYTVVNLDVLGDLRVESSRIWAGQPMVEDHVRAFGGTLEVVDSEVITLGGLMVGADRGLEVDASLLRAKEGDLQVVGSVSSKEGSSVAGGGPVVVTGSKLEAYDADLDDLDYFGTLNIETYYAPVTIAGNELIRSHYETYVTVVSAEGEGDLTMVDNAEVRAGVRDEEAPGNALFGGVTVQFSYGSVPPDVVIERNAYSLTGPFQFFAPTAVRLAMAHNQLALGDVSIDAGVNLYAPLGELKFANNAVSATAWGVYASGSAGTSLELRENVFELTGAAGKGVELSSVGSAEVHDNTFAVSGAPSGTALSVIALSNAVEVNATGNTFTGFEQALSFRDADPFDGIAAVVNHNDFDFAIDASPEVALLDDVKDVIDARHNRWGDNTQLATVQSYVELKGQTEVLGGGILLDPIVVP